MSNADSVIEFEKPRKTAEVDRVSLREKIGLGFGKGVVDGSPGTLHVLISPVYVTTMGLSPFLISIIVFIQRIWDAILDPYFGQFSDNFRSRWGRRIPLLSIAAFPLAFFFAAMWWFPAGAHAAVLFSFLLLASLAFYMMHSLYAMPLGGLILEATDDYHERTRIAGVTLAFGFAVQVGSQWILPLTQMSYWGSTVNGVRLVAIGCGILFLLAGLAPVFLCRERLYKNVARQKPARFMDGLRAVRDNASFIRLLWARCIFSFSYNVVGMLSYYMYVYRVFGGDLKGASVYLAFIGSFYHVAAIVASTLVYPKLERLIGKRLTLQVAAATMLLGCVAKMFLYHPGWKWSPIVVTITNGVANAGVALMSVAMLGDIADQDEYRTGLRREGTFSSLLSWVDKAGNSLGTFLTGGILAVIGFSAKIPKQSENTLWLMKLSYVIAPAIGAAVTIWLIRHYALTQTQMYQIKDELARRRGEAADAS